jgi:uncharacterized protein YerC
MTEKREVIRRLRLGHSIRHINKSTGMHRTLIRRAERSGPAASLAGVRRTGA